MGWAKNGAKKSSQNVWRIKIKRYCPTRILETLLSCNAEGRPFWKPMHMQPIYRMHEFITTDGSARARSNAYIEGGCRDVGADLFARGLCLPSDIKMTPQQQEQIIGIVRSCFE